MMNAFWFFTGFGLFIFLVLAGIALMVWAMGATESK